MTTTLKEGLCVFSEMLDNDCGSKRINDMLVTRMKD